MTEVSKVKSDYAEKERILNTRQLKISNAKRNQNILIQRKAEELYKAKKYSQQAFNLSFLFYSCLITLFTAIRSETLRIDFTAFLIQAGNILKAVVSNAYKTAIRASEWGSKVQKQSLAIVLHNLLPVIVVLAALALVGFIIYIFIGLGKIYKKYFWDRLSLFITFFSLVGIIFFADLIRNRISINLITLFLLVQCVYIIFRSLARFLNSLTKDRRRIYIHCTSKNKIIRLIGILFRIRSAKNIIPARLKKVINKLNLSQKYSL